MRGVIMSLKGVLVSQEMQVFVMSQYFFHLLQFGNILS